MLALAERLAGALADRGGFANRAFSLGDLVFRAREVGLRGRSQVMRLSERVLEAIDLAA